MSNNPAEKVVALALVALLLCGCEPALREGEIAGKGHKAAQDVMLLMPMTTCSGGKQMTCSTMYIPMWFHYPERWYVQIKKYEETASRNGPPVTGKWREATWWVPSDVYEQAVIGGYFKVNERSYFLLLCGVLLSSIHGRIPR